jgi:hypothetical protein
MQSMVCGKCGGSWMEPDMLTDEQRRQVAAIVHGGNMIQAIKRLREFAPLSLRDSKAIVIHITAGSRTQNLGALYANSAMPKHIVDELIAEKSHALKLTVDELSKITHELQTPLTDSMIQSLLLFSVDFQERLKEVEKSLAGRRTVIDGLDVTVTVYGRTKKFT